MQNIQKITAWLRSAVRSPKFFYGILALLVLEASWIAVSAHYPMAFDEDFHFGLIKLYSHHLNPFLSTQPPSADIFGAFYRDPSYLYHWLMSFPYRLISLVFHEEIGQVIYLRFINVAIFTGGLVVLRKLLQKATKSNAIINLSLLFLVLTPVIPWLAGQINYDNLLFLLIPSVLLLTADFIQELKAKRFDLKLLTWLAILCLLSSLVKYAFLPVFFVVVVFLLVALIKVYRPKERNLCKELAAGFKQISGAMKAILLIGLVLSAGMFFQRYGVNTLKYHTPVPECNQVLSVPRCLSYGPWARNYRILQTKDISGPLKHFNVVQYTQHWSFVLWRSSFYVLNGKDSSFTVGEPLLLPQFVAVVVGTVGAVGLVACRKKIFSNPTILLLGVTVLVYAGTLWLQNYSDFRHLGLPVALQGRYLIPILAPLYLLFGVAIGYLLKNHSQAKVLIAVVVTLLFLQGGGIVTFLVRSDDTWYITDSLSAQANQQVQKVVRPIVIGK